MCFWDLYDLLVDIDDDDFENEFQSDDEEQFKDNYFNHDD